MVISIIPSSDGKELTEIALFKIVCTLWECENVNIQLAMNNDLANTSGNEGTPKIVAAPSF